jgi:hypothetical protein
LCTAVGDLAAFSSSFLDDFLKVKNFFDVTSDFFGGSLDDEEEVEEFDAVSALLLLLLLSACVT